MKWTDLKYLAAYIIPLLAFTGVNLGGYWTYSAFVFAFVMVPLIEPLLSSSSDNYTEDEITSRISSVFFDGLLLLNIPIIYGLIIYFIYSYEISNHSIPETVGLILSFGTMMGACGINVAHELGHRKSKALQFAGKVLLLPCLYNHFFIEHNRGHHKHIATDEDPASALKNENIYSFWIRSVYNSYINAWKLESKRLGNKYLSLKNEMIIYTMLTFSYIAIVYLATSFSLVLIMLAMGVTSFLLLETINYIEHYGLRRKKLENGRYERVQPIHSWNSNHYLGRIILYELTRHSDHHYLANKEFQILEHHQDSPQLPLGYPSCMLMSLVPPLWFKVMNERLPS